MNYEIAIDAISLGDTRFISEILALYILRMKQQRTVVRLKKLRIASIEDAAVGMRLAATRALFLPITNACWSPEKRERARVLQAER